MRHGFPAKGQQGVRFFYQADHQAKVISVAGTFNSWDHTKHKMDQKGSNRWELELSLPKGRHLYKIVVDDKEWITDPLNPNISEDGQNNSAITVTENGDVLIRTTDITEHSPGYMYENFQAIESPEWLKKAVIYELHLRAFNDNGFNGLADKMDYLKELGVNTLWIMPFHEVGEEKRIGEYGDPYAVKDYYSIDGSYGKAEELKALIAKAHANGMKVIMDWVMNRGSVDHILTKYHPEYFTRNESNEVYYEVPNRDYFAGLNFNSREMRAYVMKAMAYWIAEFDFDGFRLDDSDITPFDFLSEIRQELHKVKDDIVLISQSYDEYHHLESCNLTYDGSLRLAIKDLADRKITRIDFIRMYNSYKYSFPKGALRMRWLEEKECTRIWAFLGEEVAMPAASILMTVEGVPFIMMGQEFNERTLNTWTSLFEDYQLDWTHFDEKMFRHYKSLIHLRTNHAAFWNGELQFIPHSEEMVLSYIRRNEKEELLIVVNLSGNPLTVSLEESIDAMKYFGKNKNMIYRSGEEEISTHMDKHDLFINVFETQIYQMSR
ncbi:alpha-amylase family glycosyl hydrolase [Candidatus Pristimantibacillus sp. PTI5]|uniref:alpha-amylase family glycosyl hydrolase n=1 Tax=Candidatus Pristimantibacillus sp. PTI5 TaxID=3400422 RepID=UPI003B025FB9